MIDSVLALALIVFVWAWHGPTVFRACWRAGAWLAGRRESLDAPVPEASLVDLGPFPAAHPRPPEGFLEEIFRLREQHAEALALAKSRLDPDEVAAALARVEDRAQAVREQHRQRPAERLASSSLMSSEGIWDRVHVRKLHARCDTLLFCYPQGQQDPEAPYVKTASDTSMVCSSRLPNPESMTVRRVVVSVDLGTPEADLFKLVNAAWLEIWTANGSIRAWQAPLLQGFQRDSGTCVFELARPFEIFIGESFFVRLKTAHSLSYSTDLWVRCELSGDRYLVDAAGPWGPSRLPAGSSRWYIR